MNDLLGIIAPLRKFLSQEEERIHVKGLEDDLLTLPANRTYIIPDFQREIRWNEDNVSMSNVIECEYSQLVIKHSLKIAQKMQRLSLEEDNFKDSLDLFFARDYKDQYLELSKTVLDAVIERIKN